MASPPMTGVWRCVKLVCGVQYVVIDGTGMMQQWLVDNLGSMLQVYMYIVFKQRRIKRVRNGERVEERGREGGSNEREKGRLRVRECKLRGLGKR